MTHEKHVFYRHAAGESVDADALDEAMRHGREITPF